MNTTVQDLRFAVRQLRRSPGFALTAVLTLALAIGAACVMFAVVHSTLLAPLPYPAPEQLVGLGLDNQVDGPGMAQTGESAHFLTDHARSFASFGIADGGPHAQNLSLGSGEPVSVPSLRVSAGYFPTLGVAPLLGRSFTAAEDTPGSGDVVMLSEGLWRGALGGDMKVLGRVLRMNGAPATVVGVMPASFMTVDAPALWQPLRLSPADPGYEGTNCRLLARLRPGVSLARANAELATLTPALLRASATLRHWAASGGHALAESVWPLQRVVTADARRGILALACASVALLLIACLNLAALMTARAAARWSELAVRSALGASRAALLRLMAGESLLLGLGGGLLGLAIAFLLLPILVSQAPLQLPKLHDTTIDLRIALVGVVTGLLCTFLFGCIPAVAVLRRQPTHALGGMRSASSSAPQQRLGKVLLTAQVALATALLSIGAVLLGTFAKLRAQTPGIRPAHLDVLQVQLKGERYRHALPNGQFITAVLEKLSAIPGVGSAAAIYGLPLEGGLNTHGGPADRPDEIKMVETRFITPGYLQTAGTPLLAGEDLSARNRNHTQPVALINQLAAQRWFGGPNGALERAIVLTSKEPQAAPKRVLGVVAPVHAVTLADAQTPTIYLPIAQMDDAITAAVNGWFPVSLCCGCNRSRPTATSPSRTPPLPR